MDRLYSSRGGNGFSSLLLGLPQNLATVWTLLLPSHIWSVWATSELHHHHCHYCHLRHRRPTTWHRSPVILRRSTGHFRSFSERTQLQLSLFDCTSELVITLLLPLNSTLALVIVVFLLALNLKMGATYSSSSSFFSFETSQMALLSLDVVAFSLAYQATLKRLLLFYKTLPIICLAWYRHSREVLGAVAVKQMKAFSSSQRFSAAIGTIWVAVFMKAHSELLVDLVHLNRHLVSPLLYWFYNPIIVGSVFTLCLLYFRPVAFCFKLYLLGAFIGCLATFALLGFLSAVVCTLYDHQADSALFRAQMLCRRSSAAVNRNENSIFLRIKLKLMSYYEVLRTEEKVTFTFGSYAKVDNQWLLEVKTKMFFLFF